MSATAIFSTASLSVVDYRCEARPGDAPYLEHHGGFDLAYVRRGSFGYCARGRRAELVAGGLLVGKPGEAFHCTHDHAEGGDECLHFQFGADLVDNIGDIAAWPAGGLMPVPALMVWGSLAQAAAEGRCDVSLEEAGVLLASHLYRVAAGNAHVPVSATPRERRRAIEAARWIEARQKTPVSLEAAARHAGLSPYHFLRVFASVLGVSPHQYLIRCRLARAAALLAGGMDPVTAVAFDTGFGDISNFIRSFRRAAGISPRAFRKLARGDRKILQERLAAPRPH